MHALCGLSRNHALHTTQLDAHIVGLHRPVIAFVGNNVLCSRWALPSMHALAKQGSRQTRGKRVQPTSQNDADTHEGCW